MPSALGDTPTPGFFGNIEHPFGEIPHPLLAGVIHQPGYGDTPLPGGVTQMPGALGQIENPGVLGSTNSPGVLGDVGTGP